MRRWARRIGLSVASLALCLAAIEGGLRLGATGTADFVAEATTGSHPAGLYLDGPRVRMKPNVEVLFESSEYSIPFRTNSLGMRGPEPTVGGLLCLGDSFTAAAQVREEQSWCALLDGANGGVPGYGTYDEVAALRELGPRVQPTQVVVAFYLGNDLRDNKAAETPPPPVARTPVSAVEQRLSDLSRRASRLSYTWTVLSSAWALRHPDFRIDEYRDEMQPFIELTPDLRDPTRRALAELEGACEGRRCQVVLVPPLYVVDERRREATFAAFGLQAPADIDALARQVEELTRLPVLDLTPALRAAEGPLYHRFDPHWNAEGHRVAAEAIAAILDR